MKKNKKKLKGMTLVEVLIGLAVFTIMSSLLAGSVLMVCNIVRRTDKLNTRISNEAPNAEIKKDGVLDPIAPTVEIDFGGVKETVVCDKYIVTDKPENNYDGGNFKYIKPKTP